jgi:hypothetical protein
MGMVGSFSAHPTGSDAKGTPRGTDDPNPVYGDWFKLAKERPLEVMNPTTMKAPR